MMWKELICSLVGALKLAGEPCPVVAAPVIDLCSQLQDKPNWQLSISDLPDFSSPANWNLNSMVIGFFFPVVGGFCLFWLGVFLMDRHCLSGNKFLGKAELSQQAGRWNHAQEVRMFIFWCNDWSVRLWVGRMFVGWWSEQGVRMATLSCNTERWMDCGALEGG